MKDKGEKIKKLTAKLIEAIKKQGFKDRVTALNYLKLELKKVSPFKKEPVDCVLWIPAKDLVANDYNPNKVAPPEMKLLELSITKDGYTQPIVSWKTKEGHEVIDGFHRYRVGTESKTVSKRVKGYLPITTVNKKTTDRGSRIAATIRHNRARGKHVIDDMASIVLELKRRNWSNKKIGINLGMDPDEILRLSQITGLAEMFKDKEFSKAWEIQQIDQNDKLEDWKNEADIS